MLARVRGPQVASAGSPRPVRIEEDLQPVALTDVRARVAERRVQPFHKSRRTERTVCLLLARIDVRRARGAGAAWPRAAEVEVFSPVLTQERRRPQVRLRTVDLAAEVDGRLPSEIVAGVATVRDIHVGIAAAARTVADEVEGVRIRGEDGAEVVAAGGVDRRRELLRNRPRSIEARPLREPDLASAPGEVERQPVLRDGDTGLARRRVDDGAEIDRWRPVGKDLRADRQGEHEKQGTERTAYPPNDFVHRLTFPFCRRRSVTSRDQKESWLRRGREVLVN